MTMSQLALSVDWTLGSIPATAGSCRRVPPCISFKVCQAFPSEILCINTVVCTPWFNDSVNWGYWVAGSIAVRTVSFKSFMVAWAGRITAWNADQTLSQELTILLQKSELKVKILITSKTWLTKLIKLLQHKYVRNMGSSFKWNILSDDSLCWYLKWQDKI